MSEQETQPPAALSEEEVKQLQQDITAAKNNVVSEETQKIIEAEREKGGMGRPNHGSEIGPD